MLKLSCYRHSGAKEERKLAAHSLYGTSWDNWVSVTPRPRFNPREKTTGSHWTGGWVGLRVGLDTGSRKKTFASGGDGTAVVQSVVRHYTELL
jgi:hypothetical protein